MSGEQCAKKLAAGSDAPVPSSGPATKPVRKVTPSAPTAPSPTPVELDLDEPQDAVKFILSKFSQSERDKVKPVATVFVQELKADRKHPCSGHMRVQMIHTKILDSSSGRRAWLGDAGSMVRLSRSQVCHSDAVPCAEIVHKPSPQRPSQTRSDDGLFKGVLFAPEANVSIFLFSR